MLLNIALWPSCYKNYKETPPGGSQYTRHKGLEGLHVYNDNIEMEEDLPRYYRAFGEINFWMDWI